VVRDLNPEVLVPKFASYSSLFLPEDTSAPMVLSRDFREIIMSIHTSKSK
jgi:hypothetical protein